MKRSSFIALGILLLGLLAGGIALSAHPSYTVYALFSSARDHDYHRFSSYANVDDIAQNAMELAFNERMRDMKRRFGRNTPSEQRFLEIYMTQNKPILKNDLKFSLKHQIETDEFYPDHAPANLWQTFRRCELTKNQHVATIYLAPGPSSELPPLRIRLRRVRMHWQAFELMLDIEKAEHAKSDAGKKNI